MRLLPSKLGKISSFTLLLVATLFCTSGLNATAQDQTAPANNTDSSVMIIRIRAKPLRLRKLVGRVRAAKTGRCSSASATCWK